MNFVSPITDIYLWLLKGLMKLLFWPTVCVAVIQMALFNGPHGAEHRAAWTRVMAPVAKVMVESAERGLAQQQAELAQAPSAPAPPPVGPISDRTSWANAFLAAAGEPQTSENVRAVVGWEKAEGGHWADSARFNPLNTTQAEPGSVPINSVGVQAFTSWAQGLQATVATIRNGRYGGILAALAAGNCAQCVANAVAASPWGTGRFTP
jgi:hypothetical protein